MSNKIGTVQLELYRDGSLVPAVIGTECVVSVDGRWSHARAVEYLRTVAEKYCASRNLEWRGSVYLLGGRYRSMKLA